MQIEATQISQDEMYYLKYLEKTDDNQEIQNLKNTIQYAYNQIQDGKTINFSLVNKMHKIILSSVRGLDKTPGQIRTTQNWIGSRSVGIDGAIFIPPALEDIYELLLNLCEYMNDEFIAPLLINIALSHAQFETIYAYNDGNGRLGYALIPVQLDLLDKEKPILYYLNRPPVK
ncbi:Fic family protein [Longibaculum muris]|uniref:Fic family protein n=1 Tax=Longibaculum muris TaxID=1796628 RepID=UPI0022E28974|nr:Fic family protein [Longibaculum muris]